VNQAKKPGFFGWPYFVGNNYAYRKYDFAAKKPGAPWDPAKPINESPNNTGKRELPPANPAFVWYPYVKSEDFPMVKEGGRNAMAGPVYYSENYKGVATAFPDYFDGKLLIYDWMRNWMMLVTMDSTGAIKDIEPFMQNTKFNNIIDMAYSPDGRLYMIEYGTAWFKQNLDARLARIDYNGGNRPPVVQLAADKLSGSTPLVVSFSSGGTHDYDGDKLTYELDAAGKIYTSEDGNFKVSFEKAGVYNVKLTVKDIKGQSSTAQLQVTAGNEPPEVMAEITGGNKTFFFPGTPVQYAVHVSDKEDGATTDGKIPAESVTVTFNYLKGYDLTQIAQGHQMPTAELPGKELIDKSDCKSCHLVNEKSAGPGYKDIASKYKSKPDAIGTLAAKIIKGGAGVWGTTEMAAHPQISVDDAKKMVEYILSLGKGTEEEKKLPLKGTAIPGKEEDGAYILTATYFDKGANGVPSLSRSASVALRGPFLRADQAQELNIARVVRADNQVGLENVKNNAHAVYKKLDLTGVKSATLMSMMTPEQAGGEIEIRLDQPDGERIGIVKVTKPGISKLDTSLEAVTGYHDLYVVFKNQQAGDKALLYFGGIQLKN
jgi:cytochrome c